LACGLNLNYSTIFVQSHVSAHSELTWLLNCITPLNWLEDMIQFKEKAVKQGECQCWVVGLSGADGGRYFNLQADKVRWEKIRSNTSNSPAILQLGLTTTFPSAGFEVTRATYSL